MNKKPTYRIRKTRKGYAGYYGSRKVAEFGKDAESADDWLENVRGTTQKEAV